MTTLNPPWALWKSTPDGVRVNRTSLRMRGRDWAISSWDAGA
ncbi:hypothetical protein [Streptomyces sp. RPA4-2]|nr:hypothetical protein [Streptomyces sp. RPA4-2]